MKSYFLYLIALLPFFSEAFIPDLGHLVRHQPMMLRGNPQSFTVDGSLEINGERAPFKVTWVGTKTGYALEFLKVPSSWTTAPISELILFRDGPTCMLSLNKAPYPCSAMRFWGDFEFNGSAERVLQTVASLGLASSSDLTFKAINSKELEAAKRVSKVKPSLKNIQGVFLSTLEFTNGANSIAFDSTTYSPLYARFPVDGMMWEFTGSPEFFLEKEENKNNLIVSKRIEIKEGEKLIAIVRRDALKRANKLTLPKIPSTRGTASDVPYDRFTEAGRNFLKTLFLTH